jgi:hypothetical protein
MLLLQPVFRLPSIWKNDGRSADKLTGKSAIRC